MPALSTYHDQTKDYLVNIRHRRNTHSVTVEQKQMLPKAITDREIPNIKKIADIREQMRKIEQKTESEKLKVKARLIEKDERFYQ